MKYAEGRDLDPSVREILNDAVKVDILSVPENMLRSHLADLATVRRLRVEVVIHRTPVEPVSRA